MVWLLLYRPSPRPCHAWRAMLLRAFGAKAGAQCHFYPGSKVWAPWNLRCEDRVTLADGAEIYNPSLIHFGSHAIVSQGAYVCGATHLYNEPEFRMVSRPMKIGAYAWICARAIVGPGVNVGEGAVLGLGSVASKDLEAFGVYVGSPARKVKERDRSAIPEESNTKIKTADPSIYMGLREQALQFRLRNFDQNAVHAVLMDWFVGSGTATTVAIADGTASVYLSNGGGFIGGSQTNLAIREAAAQAIKLATSLEPAFTATGPTGLPKPGEVFFYLTTNAGIFVAKAAEDKLRAGTDKLTNLGNAMQAIITAYQMGVAQ